MEFGSPIEFEGLDTPNFGISTKENLKVKEKTNMDTTLEALAMRMDKIEKQMEATDQEYLWSRVSVKSWMVLWEDQSWVQSQDIEIFENNRGKREKRTMLKGSRRWISMKAWRIWWMNSKIIGASLINLNFFLVRELWFWWLLLLSSYV